MILHDTGRKNEKQKLKTSCYDEIIFLLMVAVNMAEILAAKRHTGDVAKLISARCIYTYLYTCSKK